MAFFGGSGNNIALPRARQMYSRVESLVKDMLSRERRANINDALSIARSWMPCGEYYTYAEEMQNRVSYFLGSMQADMREVLKRRFPETYQDLEKDQLNLRVVRRLLLNRAKTFSDSGRFFLVDGDDEIDPDSPSATTFAEMLRLMNVRSVLTDADVFTQLCHRSAFKAWWDARKRCVRVAIYPPHQVYLVPDPSMEWDADACWAQLYERAGSNGLTSKARYEVWGVRDPLAREATGQDTIHYVSDGDNDYKINDADINPFIDPLTGKQMYPMVWWQDDTTTALYVLGAEDLLTVNRSVNAGLTDLANNIHFQAFGVPVYSMPAGSGAEPPARRTLSPRDAVDLPPGTTLDFKSPGLVIDPVVNFWQLLVRLEALVDGQTPNAVRVEGQDATSGYALKIENIPLAEHRSHMIDVYREQVEESLRRCIVIWNTYAREYGRDEIDSKLMVRWEPGEISTPIDEEQIGRVYAAEIMSNVSTAVDWRMARYGETREVAERAVKENAKLNAEIANGLDAGANADAEKMGEKFEKAEKAGDEKSTPVSGDGDEDASPERNDLPEKEDDDGAE